MDALGDRVAVLRPAAGEGLQNQQVESALQTVVVCFGIGKASYV